MLLVEKLIFYLPIIVKGINCYYINEIMKYWPLKLEKDTSSILRSFLGSLTSKKKTDSNEDYWKLIGEKGKVIEENGDELLVLFKKNLDDYGLENHNPVKNSLWIRRSDLEIEE